MEEIKEIEKKYPKNYLILDYVKKTMYSQLTNVLIMQRYLKKLIKFYQ